MQERTDAGNEEWRKGGMKKRKDSGLQRFRTTVEGYRRGEIQEMRVQDRKRIKTRWIQKNRRDAGQDRCRKGGMQDWRDVFRYDSHKHSFLTISNCVVLYG